MWVVIDAGTVPDTVFGPFDDEEAAEEFAEEQGEDAEAYEVQPPPK